MWRKRRIAVLAALALALTACASGSNNPLDGTTFYVNPDSAAARSAAAETDPELRAAFESLAAVPTGIWLLPEAHPAEQIYAYVDQIVSSAAAQSATPILVVYGIPSRDCGNFSAGGSSSEHYGAWISLIAKAIGDRKAVVILEPDSLALSPSCGTEDATAGFLRDAIERLAADRTTIYLDGGHSDWLPAEEMASLLRAAGVADVRGFATNVSNYNDSESEHEYGDKLSALLGGAHYVTDTSRNGNGSNGEWCNPTGRAIGEGTTGAASNGAQDGSLWVKAPGESDGNCNGGPSAGVWWPEAAVALEQARQQ
ncbi:MAG: glycoside hydrolase family 6 protein [Rhodoglobus sp.]